MFDGVPKNNAKQKKMCIFAHVYRSSETQEAGEARAMDALDCDLAPKIRLGRETQRDHLL